MLINRLLGRTLPLAALLSATPVQARDIMAMCSTSDYPGKFVTTIAPVAAPVDATYAQQMKDKLKYVVDDTMWALGMDPNASFTCSFEDRSLIKSDGLWMDGNSPQSDMVDYQRRLMEMGWQLFKVDRLDSGASTPKGGVGAASPPPDKHDDGQPLRFYYVVGMMPRADDVRNPDCYSNIMTLPEKVDWTEWGAEGRADALTAPYRAAFVERCSRQGAITPNAAANAIVDRRDGQFKHQIHPTDRTVVLP